MLGGQTVRDVSPQREKHKRPLGLGSGVINRLHRIMVNNNWTKQIVLCPPHQSSHKDCLFSQTTHESVFASVQAHPPCLCKCARVLTASAWCWWSRISDQWYFENDIWFLHWQWPYHPWQWNNNHSLPSNTADLVWSWVVQFNPQSWGFYKSLRLYIKYTKSTIVKKNTNLIKTNKNDQIFYKVWALQLIVEKHLNLRFFLNFKSFSQFC